VAGFSRRARWLNGIFPASEAPQIQDPGTRSDDVSLVQPYDGSGWGLNQDPEEWTFQGGNSGTPGSAGTFILVQVPLGFIFRILAASGRFTVGNNPNIGIQLGRPSNRSILIGRVSQGDMPGIALSTPVALNTPIVPGGWDVTGFWDNGDGLTVVEINVMGILAPEGTVFYV